MSLSAVDRLGILSTPKGWVADFWLITVLTINKTGRYALLANARLRRKIRRVAVSYLEIKHHQQNRQKANLAIL